MKRSILDLPLAMAFLVGGNASAQLSFTRDNSIPVTQTGLLKMPWTGGHNFCQFSDIDMNFDGKKDLFVFDRTGNKITTYVNNGAANTVDYIFSDQFPGKFPALYSWALLLDYNCDGKEDIFTYAMPIAGIKVWRNTSSGGNLQFTLETAYIKSNYNPSVANLYVSQVDIPSIEDIDGDGDKDVLTYDFSGTIVEFHKNLSEENGYGCDSLIFQLDVNGCWGNFSESPANCNIFLNQSCRMGLPHPVPPLYEVENEGHSGSCSLCLDMDDDGDKDLIVGDLSCCTMTLLTNGGIASSANITAYEDSFPSGTKFIQQTIFPCGYAVDVNNDGNRDLLVSPNQAGTSFDQASILYYKNTGTDSTPVFSYMKKAFLQEDMIDVGEGAYPVLFDYTADGVLDLLIANSRLVRDTDSCVTAPYYNIYAYKNTGTAASPSFQLDTDNFGNTSTQIPTLRDLYPAFGDLDNDGDDDMMIGDYNGQLHYFTNTAGAAATCSFVLTQSGYLDDGGTLIDVGLNATPQLIDVDRDGLLDLIIGERSGNLNYYLNIGSPAVPKFAFQTDSFGKVDVRVNLSYGHSVPFLYDLNSAYHLLVGSTSGNIFHYDSIDGNLAGAFNLLSNKLQNIWEGPQTAVTGADLDADGAMDLIIGNFCGGVSCWKGSDSLVIGTYNMYAAPSLTVYPNPSRGAFSLRSPSSVILYAEVYDLQGTKILQNQVNSNSGILDLSQYKKGMYLCRITTEQGTVNRKLLLER